MKSRHCKKVIYEVQVPSIRRAGPKSVAKTIAGSDELDHWKLYIIEICSCLRCTHGQRTILDWYAPQIPT